MRRWIGASLSIAVGVALGLAGVPLLDSHLPAGPLVRGLSVGGERIAPDAEPTSWLRAVRAVAARRPIVLQHDAERHELTVAQLGLEVDVTATVRRAEAIGHVGSLVRRLRDTARARRGEIDVPLSWRLDEDRARATLEAFVAGLHRDPVDASLDLAGHRRIPDRPGQELDVDAVVGELRRRAQHGEVSSGDTLLLVTRELPARVTLGDLDDIAVDKLLARFETRFATFKVGRAANVAKAAGLLDGLVIRPGETVSFNERIGPRTVERGFQQAPEILGDELTIGIGGGTCQVASTFHGASVYGGLEVVERKSHSRPSDYTLLGLDATVAYPAVDLRVRNPYPFKVVVHGSVPEPGLLRIELLGGEAVADVKYSYGVGNVEDFVRRITVRPFLKNGRVMRWQKGTRGMDVHSVVTLLYKDGRSETRQYFSGYRASPEVLWVAPDYDPAKLPELPPHAKGVEGQLPKDDDVYSTM